MLCLLIYRVGNTQHIHNAYTNSPSRHLTWLVHPVNHNNKRTHAHRVCEQYLTFRDTQENTSCHIHTHRSACWTLCNKRHQITYNIRCLDYMASRWNTQQIHHIKRHIILDCPSSRVIVAYLSWCCRSWWACPCPGPSGWSASPPASAERPRRVGRSSWLWKEWTYINLCFLHGNSGSDYWIYRRDSTPVSCIVTLD